MVKWYLSLCALLVTIGLTNGQQFLNRTRRQSGPPCSTPDKIQGVCVNIRSCPALLDLLKNSRNQPGVVEFLRRSKCNPDVASEVCCKIERDYSNLFMSPPECGKTYVNQQPRIVGGQPAELGAWPWIALLGYRMKNNPGPFWQCGGALVSERFIVTAAHCINAPPPLKLYIVRLGESELDNENDGATPVDILVESTVAHPSYSYETKQNDIGIIKLQQSVQFSRNIQPICLPKTPEMISQTFVKYFPFVAGWGTTAGGGRSPGSKKLLQIQVPVTDTESCDKVYTPKGARIINKQLCAGYPNGGKDACQGDSGGPLMLPRGNVYYLIGVVSFGYGCAQAGFPGVYTRVTSYLDWLAEHAV